MVVGNDNLGRRITHTSMQVTENYFVLCRLIDNKMNCVEFTNDITVSKAAPYFNMIDVDFIKLCTSTYVKDKTV